jgi:hypothetical protein
MQHNMCCGPLFRLRISSYYGNYHGTVFGKSLAEFEDNFEKTREERGWRASEISRVPDVPLGVDTIAPRVHARPRKHGLGSDGVQHAGTTL